MKCPNCGAMFKRIGNTYQCKYCGYVEKIEKEEIDENEENELIDIEDQAQKEIRINKKKKYIKNTVYDGMNNIFGEESTDILKGLVILAIVFVSLIIYYFVGEGY